MEHLVTRIEIRPYLHCLTVLKRELKLLTFLLYFVEVLIKLCGLNACYLYHEPFTACLKLHRKQRIGKHCLRLFSMLFLQQELPTPSE